MATDAEKKKKIDAISILDTIANHLQSVTQRHAIKAVIIFLEKAVTDDSFFTMTHEEREKWIADYYEEDRRIMSVEERKERAAFYLEGLEV
ncbi:MAG: hypothetical protein LBH43_14790 [Treponema sp.]|jgi:hypothetical protein|nr:hypothetical protein [Treponema sp.]